MDSALPTGGIQALPGVPKTLRYEFRFIDHSGRVFSRSELDAESDEEAISRGRTLYRIGIGYGFQILRESQLVHVEKFPAVSFHSQSDSLP